MSKLSKRLNKQQADNLAVADARIKEAGNEAMLSLEGLGLTELPNDDIAGMSQLLFLDLDNNQLAALPEFITRLPKR